MRKLIMTPAERLVLPLDVPGLEDAQRWIDQLSDHVGVFKVGLELFIAEGPAAVERVHHAGAACFLDLKLHDIPATMARATRAAVKLGAKYLTVHAAAGPAALAAVAAECEGTDTELLAVTILTSIDDTAREAIGVQGSSDAAVSRMAQLAANAGIRGLVCSPLECASLRDAHPDITLAVPGVRPKGSDAGDQRRIATPEDALSAGADLLVVGRPIRNAHDPIAAARAILSTLASHPGRGERR